MSLLTLSQVAHLMNCSPEVALEIAHSRKLPYERNPHEVFISVLDLAAWLAAARHAAARPGLDGDLDAA
jgi:hypothetical protein